MEYHRLDPYPIPKDKALWYVNEPQLIDGSIIVFKTYATR